MIFKRKLFQFIFCTSLAISFKAQSQNIDFACNQNFIFFTNYWGNDSINKIYGLLNKIDFEKEDFELRIWYDCAGQRAIVHNVFIMRHYIKGDKWKAFYYFGFDKTSKHRTMEQYFFNAELKKYRPKEWKVFWDTLVANNILTLVPPRQDTLSKLLNGGWMEVSHDSYYKFELIKKDCKRSYGLPGSVAGCSNFKDVPEIKTFNSLIALMKSRIY